MNAAGFVFWLALISNGGGAGITFVPAPYLSQEACEEAAEEFVDGPRYSAECIPQPIGDVLFYPPAPKSARAPAAWSSASPSSSE